MPAFAILPITFLDQPRYVGLLKTDRGLARVTLPVASREAALAELAPTLNGAREDASAFGDLPERLRRYFASEAVSLDDAVDMASLTPFARHVLDATRRIPRGATRSYGWLASAAGSPKGARAAGQALARNPVPIVVPCHRVVGASGALCGFAGGAGVSMKQALLELERASSV